MVKETKGHKLRDGINKPKKNLGTMLKFKRNLLEWNREHILLHKISMSDCVHECMLTKSMPVK